jgi:hypothetical protein
MSKPVTKSKWPASGFAPGHRPDGRSCAAKTKEQKRTLKDTVLSTLLFCYFGEPPNRIKPNQTESNRIKPNQTEKLADESAARMWRLV